MQFVWSDSGDTTIAEEEIWKYLKSAFPSDEGICYHRFPIFSADRSRREPDILIIHRQLGVFIINCKGYTINNVETIDGSKWRLKSWKASEEKPCLLYTSDAADE